MYPKKQPKSDQERFLAAFKKRVGATPEEYVRRKLASGMDEAELRRLYDLLAVEVAMKARCTALRYDALELDRRPAAQRHRERAASETISLRVQLNGAEFRVKVEDNFTVGLLKKRIMSVGARREAEA